MEIIIMRHAKAEPGNLIKYPEDDKRPLTDQGKSRQKSVAKVLKKVVKDIDAILTSPALRAKQTAEISAKILGLEDKIESTELLYNQFDPEQVGQLLKKKSMSATNVLIVGHEPSISELAWYFLGQQVKLQFKKSGIMVIAFPEAPEKGEGFLKSFYRPKELLKMLK